MTTADDDDNDKTLLDDNNPTLILNPYPGFKPNPKQHLPNCNPHTIIYVPTTAICSAACPNIHSIDSTLQSDDGGMGVEHKGGDDGEEKKEKGKDKGKEKGPGKEKKGGKKGDVDQGKKLLDGADSDKGVRKDGEHDNVVALLVERGVRHPADLLSSLSLLLEVSTLPYCTLTSVQYPNLP